MYSSELSYARQNWTRIRREMVVIIIYMLVRWLIFFIAKTFQKTVDTAVLWKYLKNAYIK